MRRWTLRVLCWLALGAVVNVGVAWGAALYFGQPDRLGRKWHSAPDWPAPDLAPSDYPHALWRCDIPAVACTMSVHTANWRETSTFVFYFRRDDYAHEQYLSACGWPARCLQQIWVGRGTKFETPWSRRLPGWFATRRDPNAVVPIMLIPAGFVINTLFYALPIALLWLAPCQFRRWHRRRHHLCVHCAYPVADHAKPCSECGNLPTTR